MRTDKRSKIEANRVWRARLRQGRCHTFGGWGRKGAGCPSAIRVRYASKLFGALRSVTAPATPTRIMSEAYHRPCIRSASKVWCVWVFVLQAALCPEARSGVVRDSAKQMCAPGLDSVAEPIRPCVRLARRPGICTWPWQKDAEKSEAGLSSDPSSDAGACESSGPAPARPVRAPAATGGDGATQSGP